MISAWFAKDRKIMDKNMVKMLVLVSRLKLIPSDGLRSLWSSRNSPQSSLPKPGVVLGGKAQQRISGFQGLNCFCLILVI